MTSIPQCRCQHAVPAGPLLWWWTPCPSVERHQKAAVLHHYHRTTSLPQYNVISAAPLHCNRVTSSQQFDGIGVASCNTTVSCYQLYDHRTILLSQDQKSTMTIISLSHRLMSVSRCHISSMTPPRRPSGKASTSGTADLGSTPVFAMDLLPGRVIPCQAPGVE